MKKYCFWAITLIIMAFGGACHRGMNHIYEQTDNDETEMAYKGEIRFNDSETAIERISPGGYLKFRHDDEVLEAGADDWGLVRYDLFDKGQKVDSASGKGQAQLARAIRKMIAMGIDAQGRMDRLYRRGGYRALLERVDSLDGDYLKGLYFDRVLASDSVSSGEMVVVISKIGRTMGSDYDRQRLLAGVDTAYLKDDSVAWSYLDAVSQIGGNYEKTQALDHFLETRPTRERYLRLLDVTADIGGDYERSTILHRVIENGLYEGPAFDSLLAVVGGVNGEYERGNLLKDIIHQELKEDREWAELIRTTAQLGSDYDKSNLLVEIAEHLPKTDSLKTVYTAAAKTVQSDNDYGRVMRAMR
jgi:hypothetical protein